MGYEISGPVSVDMIPHKRHVPVIEVSVNGVGPYKFGVDTGASSGGRIDPGLAKLVGCEEIGEAHSRDGTSGKDAIVKLYRADRIQVGGLTLKGVTLSERPSMPSGTTVESKLDGILGFGVFARLLLTLDYPNKKLRIEEGRVEQGPDTIAFTSRSGIPIIGATLAGAPVSVIVDSGSDGGIILPIGLERTLKLGQIRKGSIARTAYNSSQMEFATLDGDMKFGPITIERPQVDFLPLLRLPNIGFGVLQNYKVTFDEANGLMRIEPDLTVNRSK
jgi:hypothetical protein